MPLPAPLARAADRLRGTWRTLTQIAVATGGSWTVATVLLGYRSPFFAPIAAIIVLNGPAQRGRRALEIVAGVAVGIGVADLLVVALGTGGWQLVLVVVLAMAAVTVAGGGPLVRAQAGVAALLVASLQPPTLGLVPHRFLHAVVGGSTALVVAALLPAAPDRQLRRAAGPVFDELAGTLTAVAAALHADDLPAAEEALARARRLDGEVDALRASLEVAAETARLAPRGRGHRELVGTYADALEQLDLAVRDTRVLARSAVALLRWTDASGGPPPPVELGDAVLDLADAVRGLGAQLTEDGPADEPRRHAGAAAARTRPLYGDGRALAISRVVGQIRSTGMDLLHGSGLETDEAQRTLYDAPPPGPRTPRT